MKNQKRYQENLRKNLAISGETETFFAEYQAQKLAQWFAKDLDKELSILDFGCGDGLMTSFVQHIFTNAAITGIDTDAQRTALAQDMHEEIHFICADIETAPFAPASFDLIYSAEVFHHLPLEQQEQYIALLMHLLKPGGTLIIFELNPLNLVTVYRFKKNPHEHNAQLIMPWRLRRLLAPYGSTKIRFYDFCLRILEPYLTWLPFGGLYAVSVIKKNTGRF